MNDRHHRTARAPHRPARRGRLAGTVAALLVLASAAVVPSADQAVAEGVTGSGGVRPGTTAVAPADPESVRVGALFSGPLVPGGHFCTAAVVHSPAGNLLLTAAHCVTGGTGAVFAPGYRDGTAPFGTWQVTQVFTTDGWRRDHDPDQDVALLTVAPSARGRVEDVVGAAPLGLGAAPAVTVRLYGYPDSRETPIVCTGTTAGFGSHQRRIACPAYSRGTSGGPFVSTATGAVIGVIGGYQEGGATDDVSYSATFEGAVDGLYRTATGGGWTGS